MREIPFLPFFRVVDLVGLTLFLSVLMLRDPCFGCGEGFCEVGYPWKQPGELVLLMTTTKIEGVISFFGGGGQCGKKIDVGSMSVDRKDSVTSPLAKLLSSSSLKIGNNLGSRFESGFRSLSVPHWWQPRFLIEADGRIFIPKGSHPFHSGKLEILLPPRKHNSHCSFSR